ncbi:MAG: FecR domain-containing protein [Parabacteroides sp.]|jgi:ferric-dicitrate binding protein FerR (iron transport regulator)|uniref:FecR family protein n=3 Tax=root TaxID=1 RepID=A0A1T4ZW39_9BACT|nr:MULTISPECIES: FecR domain-containing protein [Bacteroidales]MBP7871133.1 FecR domain-containing protein [Parabacteroides sp.]HAD02012.1 anti-sigma factor [Porphyromonadaceae bacterium]MBP7938732.1 FecR domain-containing protein [Parabacteroides sp.]MBP8011385.1 FecR domain-containing protein [Parabacteroides sp.]MBP8026290.1 FecR domain-containing protein [Parabacteroides sp.]
MKDRNLHTDQTVHTDQAWNELYSRLEQDNLIPARGQKRLMRPVFAGMAAAIAVLCLCGALGIWLLNDWGTDERLLSLKNGPEDNTLVTTLEDGSIIYLAQDATLSYPEHFEADKRLVKLDGNALFDVSGNKQRPFLIETKYTTIEVVGTAFNVKNNGKNDFELSVQRGLVKVTRLDNGESSFVKAGETVILNKNLFLKSPTSDMDQFARYTERIQFKDETLANIVRVINRMSSQPVQLSSSELENRRLTVSFYDNSPAAMTELICLALGLTSEQKEDTLVISAP